MFDEDTELDPVPLFSKDILIASAVVFVGVFAIVSWLV